MSWTKEKEFVRPIVFAVAILALAIAVMWSGAQFNTVEASGNGGEGDGGGMTFPGTGTGAIPDGPGAPTLCGPTGAPRDISFNVTGLTGTITDVNVNMNITHTYAADVSATLIAPNGTSHVLFARTGTVSATACGSGFTFEGGLYTFDDQTSNTTNWWAAAQAAGFDPLPPGTYRTTAPGPQATAGNSPVTSLNATFNGVSPNGTWILRVTDSGGGDVGTVSAANLMLTTGAGPGPTPKPPYLNFFGTTRTDFAVFEIKPGSPAVNWAIVQNDNPTTTSSRIIKQPWGAGATDLVPNFGNYSGDSKVDFNLYRNELGSPANTYQILTNDYPSIGAQKYMQWGDAATDVIGREGDYNGDGTLDFTAIREEGASYRWYILNSGTNTLTTFLYGDNINDIPLPGADYTGNGSDDPAVVRIADNGDLTFFVGTTGGATISAVQWGTFNTDYIIPGGDYDGDGRADYMVWRGFGGTNSAAAFWYLKTAAGATSSVPFGERGDDNSRDIALRGGDYDGDGKTDIAVYRQRTNQFIVRRSSDMGTVIQGWGSAANTNIPMAQFGTF